MKKILPTKHNFKDLTGKIFGRWKVLSFSHIKYELSYWKVQCSCKNKTIKIITGNSLLCNKSSSCGCRRNEVASKLFTTHGKSFSRLCSIWKSMKQRCLNPNNTHYNDYGGRGIKVCDRWIENFENFLKDVEDSYNKHVEEFGEKETTLDRIDNYGNYEPGNFRWATKSEQARGTRISTKTASYEQHINFRSLIQTALSQLITKYLKTSKYEIYFDCNGAELRNYIESLWTEGMSWDNYGKGINKWQIDHIVGCNNFDLSKEEDRLKCFNYKNLQPLWHKDHIKKSKHLVTA